MSDRADCLKKAPQSHADILAELALSPEEQSYLHPLIADLDLADGNCDGNIPNLSSKELESVSAFVKDLQVSDQRKVAIQGAIINRFARNPFKELLSGPYKKILEFASQNLFIAHILLKDTKPKVTWTPSLEEKLQKISMSDESLNLSEFYDNYSAFVDELYDGVGLNLINELIDYAKGQKDHDNLESSTKKGLDELLRVDDSKDDSFQEMITRVTKPALDQLYHLDPSALELLYRHKHEAEDLFVATLEQKLGLFTKNESKDPIVYWIPLLAILNSDSFQQIERTAQHIGVLLKLYRKVEQYATDEVDRIHFEIEYTEKARLPLPLKKFEEYTAIVLSKIDELGRSSESLRDISKIQRYYAVWGRLWYYRYLAEIDSFNLKLDRVVVLEDEFRYVMRSRRDATSIEEASVYIDNADTIASVWAEQDGLIKYRFWSAGLDQTKTDLMRLATMTKEAESTANGWIYKEEGEKIKGVLADIRWKMYGDSYIRAGLSIQGLQNIDSEQSIFRETETYAQNLNALREKYPWLVYNNRITLDNLGEHGEEAYDISETAFLISNSNWREAGVNITCAVIGSAGGPAGTIAGSGVGKGVNWLINRSDPNAKEVLRNAEATGIPLISKSLAEEFSHANTIDWMMNVVTSLMMFKFSRSLLSFGRGTAQASLEFLRTGGIQTSAKSLGAWSVRAAEGSLNAVKGSSPNVVKGMLALPRRVATGSLNGLRALWNGTVKIAKVSIPNYFGKTIPGVFRTANVVAKYGEAGLWNRSKFVLCSLYDGWLKVWNKVGIPAQMGGGAAGMAVDYYPDHKFNEWYGSLGASLWINVLYGKLVWGWNPNGGMAGFFWRYGFEIGVQWAQGGKISQPDFEYTVAGMFSAYTARGVNKIYSLGRAAVGESKHFLKKIAHFVERNKVLVPQSVVGRFRIFARSGLARGETIRLGKPEKMDLAYLRTVSDGHVLKVEIAVEEAKFYKIRILRKATDAVSGDSFIAESFANVPKAGRLSQWFAKTTHPRLGAALLYRIPDKLLRPLTKKLGLTKFHDWWVNLAQRRSTPTRPIYNIRGSIANSEILPLIGVNGALLGVLQDADPLQMGLYRAADYGAAYLFQHKFQHLWKIDSVPGTFIGYALGIPMCIFGLPLIFPSLIQKAPGLSKEKDGYYDSLASGDFTKANDSLKTSISSLTILHNVPLIGAFWNKFSPLGSVEDSNWMIEDKGAAAFWNQMSAKVALAETELENMVLDANTPSPDDDSHVAVNKPRKTPNLDVIRNFMAKVKTDAHKYFFDGKLPPDPATLRLHVLELALLKRMMNDPSTPFIRQKAIAVAQEIEPILENIPVINNDAELRRFATSLNTNKLIDINRE